MTPAQEAALALHTKGWALIPVPYRQKAPVSPGWQRLRLTADELLRAMSVSTNIGVLLGEPSGNLIDVDLDSHEALVAALYLLPTTGCRSGRRDAKNSHWYYVIDGEIGTTRFRDPTLTKTDGRAMLVELRSTGSQTLVPPSVHPTGDLLSWDSDREPFNVAAGDLEHAVGSVAAVSLLARSWPQEGARHEAALALVGGLLRHGWEQEDINRFVRALCAAADDEEVSDRLATIPSTREALAAGKPATGWRRLGELVGTNVVTKVRVWLCLTNSLPEHIEGDDLSGPSSSTPNARSTSNGLQRRQEPSQATRIVAIAYESGVRPFRDQDGEPYAVVPVAGHEETWPIRSDAFKLHLAQRYFGASDKAPGGQMLTDARNILEGEARFAGPTIPVAVRIAKHQDILLLDLGDASWRAIRINRAGWTVREAHDLPVRFRRPKGLRELPHPASAGDLAALRLLLNIQDERDYILIVGWLLGALYPSGARPLLQLLGEQGSAKSSAARLLRSLLDPNLLLLRSAPKDEGDLLIAARNNALLAFDNLSSIPRWLSDALCRLATGGGLSKRELYTDADEVLLDARRPVLLTGISDIVTASDLLDRTITVVLPPIPATNRRTEHELQRMISIAQPRILTAVLDAAVVGMQRIDGLVLDDPPRMADFATWVEACAPALGWSPGTFLDAFRENRQLADSLAIESTAVGDALLMHMDRYDTWEGTGADLLDQLSALVPEPTRRERSWPAQPNQLSNVLQRLAPNLRALGIEMTLRRSGGRRLICLCHSRVIDDGTDQ